MNKSFSVEGRNLCGECADASFAGIPNNNIDTTICFKCGADAGDQDLPLMASLPVCGVCEEFFRNRPFPLWVKAASFALAVIVVFALVWNSRFILAYTELRQMETAIADADLKKVESLITSVANRIPEKLVFKTMMNYWHGIALLRDDRCQEALSCFKMCKNSPDLPPKEIDSLIKNAALGVAFNDGNYDEFLRLSLDMAKASPRDAFALGSVASAYACKYAKEDNEEYRQKSLEFLEKANALNPGPEFDEFKMRVHHRLFTHEIVTANEFWKKFPNGWYPEKERQP
ncbi:MAG TPA: hypothetical protein PLI09_12340 [Candidatus Hydrogenedentes bacterium]|nr:hypothetical protein [Candidatus Hydrogenedentota bacterium]